MSEPESREGRRRHIRGSRILVTGGAGFLGSRVVELLLAERADLVTVIDNFSSGARGNLASHAGDRRLRVIEADLRDVEAVVAATRGIELIVHLAALPFERSLASPRECLEVMVDGTVNVLEAAVDARVRKIALASCASVYGRPSYLPIDEEHPLRTGSPYGAAKIASEAIARAYHEMYGLEFVALRYFRVYGPRMTVDAWPRAFPESFTEPGSTGVSASPAVRGGARDNPPFDLVFVDDAARAVLLALESPVGDRVYNIAAGIEGSAERVREEIGWKPGTSLEQGLDAVLPVSVS